MKNVYVVVRQMCSPVAITHPWPIKSFASLKDARGEADRLNKGPGRYAYGVARVPFSSKEKQQ